MIKNIIRISALAWKDVLLRFSSRVELLFFIILPVIFSLGVAQLGVDEGNGDDRIAFPVVDEDRSSLSTSLMAALETSDTARPELAERAQAEGAFDRGEVTAWLVIPAGAGQSLEMGQPAALEIRLDPTDATALAVEQAVRAAASQASRELAVARAAVQEAEQVRPFADQAERQAYFERSLEQAGRLFADAPERVAVSFPAASTASREQAENNFSMAAQASAGQLIIWVFIPLLATSELFAYERANGTLRRLLTTPTPKAIYLLGTITGQLGVGLFQMLLLVAFGVFVLRVPWGQSLSGLAALLVSFGLASVAFGTLLGTFVRSTGQANGLSIMLGMTMGLLGGCMMPLEFFPPAVRTAVHVLPVTWAMEGMTDLTMRGQGLAGVLPKAAALLGFAIVFFILGVRRFRYE